jgi:hypothetical protein
VPHNSNTCAAHIIFNWHKLELLNVADLKFNNFTTLKGIGSIKLRFNFNIIKDRVIFEISLCHNQHFPDEAF